MSRTFFNALGRSLMRKHASRIPWPALVQTLRKKELLPGMVPRLPFLEPEPEPEIIPVPIEVPVPVPVEKSEGEPAPEPRPKSKPESEKAPTVEPTDR